MRPIYFFFPVVAFFAGALGTAIGSAPEFKWAFPLGWSIALLLIVIWGVLDLKGFRKIFVRKGMKYGAASSGVIVLGICVLIGFAVLSQRPRFNKMFDVTTLRLNSLSDQSVKIIDSINSKNAEIKVVAFFRNKTSESSFRDLIDLYVNKGLMIKPEYLDIEAEPVRAMAENVTSANTVIFKLENSESRITIFNEEKITNALIKLLKSEQKKIYFLEGHGEGSINSDETTGYSFVNRMLKNEHYGVESLSLTTLGEIPNDAHMLVVAGMKYDLQIQEIQAIENFVRKGGGVLFGLDAVTTIPNLISLIQKFGVQINNDLVLLAPDDPRVKHYGQNNAFITEFDSFNSITKDFSGNSQTDLIMPFTRSLTVIEKNDFQMVVEVPAKSNEKMIQIKGVEKQQDLGNVTEDRIDTVGVYPVMAVATGKKDVKNAKKETRIVVIGSASFIKNQVVQGSIVSQDLFMNIINYILHDEEFISIRPKETKTSSIALTSTSSQVTLLIMCGIYPILFLGIGILFWVRRKNT